VRRDPRDRQPRIPFPRQPWSDQPSCSPTHGLTRTGVARPGERIRGCRSAHPTHLSQLDCRAASLPEDVAGHLASTVDDGDRLDRHQLIDDAGRSIGRRSLKAPSMPGLCSAAARTAHEFGYRGERPILIRSPNDRLTLAALDRCEEVSRQNGL